MLPSASAQALSYREAVLRAVDQFNEKSSEANLFRLLELDPPPKDVSWGGGWEGDLSPDILGHTVAPSLRLVLLSGRHFSHYVGSHLFQETFPDLGPSQHQASCLSISAVGTGALHTWLRLPGLLGAPGMEGVTEVTSLLKSP